MYRMLQQSFTLISHLPLPSRPNMKENMAPTNRAPERVFPMVTGIKFRKRACPIETLPPAHNRPAGSMNMLATECSNPMLTKVEMGSQMLMYFPPISFACILKYTAKQTSQLQNMALTKTGPKP